MGRAVHAEQRTAGERRFVYAGRRRGFRSRIEPQLRFAVLFVVAFALTVLLSACSREANPTSEEPEVTVLLPTPTATVAPATSTPEPTVPPPTSTPVPEPVEEPPPFPTPDVDLSDYSVYGETLLEAFAEDAARLPDAPHYFIEARLVPGEVPSLEGVQRVRITNQEESSLTELYFRLYPNLPAYEGTAQVSRALVDGKVATVGDLFDGTAVFIPLEGGLAAGETTDVTLWFRSTLPTQVSAGTAGAGLYGFVEGVYDLAGFYPTLAVYDHRGWDLDAGARFGDSLFADIGYYQVALTVPEALSVVASGSTLAQELNGDGTTTWRIAAGPVRSFYAAVTDRWEAVSEDVDGITVNSYYPVGGLASAQTALSYTTGSLGVFNRMFGQYPYRELDVVPLPTTAFGMEHAGLLALAANFYGEGGGGFSIATPHEVAHQWFFNLVGNDQPDEPWLDESLANYAVYLYYEAVEWPQMQTVMMENVFRYRYDAARNLGIDRPVSGAVVGFDQSNYINIIYSKGPLFLHAVRERMGDAAFFAALLDYAQTYRYGIAYAEDLLDIFRRHSGSPIDDLIALWIYGE